MGFSSEWEQRYTENTHLSVWPWSDIVSLVHRHCKPIISKGGGRILELGCGAGANIPLFRALGMEYFAIEGSPTIVKQLNQRYPDLVDNIMVGDFTLEQPFECDFDLVIDRAALTHNNTASIKNALQIAFDSLKLGGIFIGSDWFSKNHDDFSGGEVSDDEFTRTNHTKGSFAGVGKVHFSNERHLRDLFTQYEIVSMEEKLMRRYEPKDNHQFASWNIVARKPFNVR
ncbi:MAG: class I SAM-dependent methyltransferase [Methylococcaceae bacterium]|nr:class I SAM-dependent methyltransferase [Methylococcaceae bacterium]MDZ4158088.1 class I SAM-dependent methyltransferase [Methylococcales bacterium]MDP2392879.1 class I SAM-dependent methyltransferase [Methylococcaceae bacterium]MDP3020407.1 class I SAM-dependent methyltransferase [Methylococcaceae bacterium]MDP3390892.1 class I SAM-dependent methyltransferase [Methylococcaceae bacterium]